jgi:hypothetical protein
MKDAGLRVRVEKELREEFVGTCRLQGTHAAVVLRDFMRAYVAREKGGRQSSLFSAVNRAKKQRKE